jgi:hypothetical protein
MSEVSGITCLHLSMPALLKIIDEIPLKCLSNPEEFKASQ